MKKRTKKFLLHASFWTIHVIYRWTFVISTKTEFNKLFYVSELLILAVKMSVTYTICFLIYRFLVKKKFYTFFIYTILTIVISVLLHQIILIIIFSKPELIFEFRNFSWVSFGSSIAQIYPIAILVILITLFRIWYNEQLNNIKLRHEQRVTELSYLKAQIHPHFLFNTINNIYSTTIHSQEKTPHLLMKLSEVLRYIIYETKSQKIPLVNEIEMIESYIELEKVRYGDRLKLLFNKKGNFSNIEIAPLLFLPLVENSFKHGAAESIGTNWISIDIESTGKRLLFKVENSIEKSNLKRVAQGGVGLENLQRRLNLIYRDNHTLELFNEDNSFLSILTLNFE